MIAAILALIAVQQHAPTPLSPTAAAAAPAASVSIPIPEAEPGIALPHVEGPRDEDRPLVVIDAGHGGHDPGAVNGERGWREKDVTLGIARALRDELVAGGRVRVALTRSDDRYLALQERYGIARRLEADLFLSIHADAAPNEAARGASIYTLSEVASTREAARLAARENRSDIINGVDLSRAPSSVSSILIDLTRRGTMEESVRFAEMLEREAGSFMRFQRPARHFASLVVLKAPDVPSVLLETGYISNADDARMLASRTGQRRIAQGVARAIRVYFAKRTVAR